MKKPMARTPPSGAPEGTVWFGGPVDRFKVTLRIYGEDLDPDHISTFLGCGPTKSERKGVPASGPSGNARVPKRGRWSLTIDSRECSPTDNLEDGMKALLARLRSDPEVWASLTSRYEVDLFCGLFLTSSDRGFTLSPEVSQMLTDRKIEIGFDVYFDPPE